MTGKTKADLDAARAPEAAQREEAGRGFTLSVRGEEFAFPPEMPLGVSYYQLEVFEAREQAEQAASSNGDAAESNLAVARLTVKTLQALLGDQFERFLGTGASSREAADLLRACIDQYGVTEGGSQASAEPSDTTGEPPRPTSKATTT